MASRHGTRQHLPQTSSGDDAEQSIDTRLTIDADGLVTVYSGKVELGTGVRTALAQIVAEALDVPFERITLVMGDTGLTPDEGGTTGSKTLQDAGSQLQRIAAEARHILLARAAVRCGVPVNELQTRDGVVRVRIGHGVRVADISSGCRHDCRRVPEERVSGGHIGAALTLRPARGLRHLLACAAP